MRIRVILEPSDEGGYTAYVPSLPGCISEGETIEECLANFKEAIELYLAPVEDDWVVDEKVAVREIDGWAKLLGYYIYKLKGFYNVMVTFLYLNMECIFNGKSIQN